jgi:aryl-alcohol dehydrogenase-like predicted oxidoreductase
MRSRTRHFRGDRPESRHGEAGAEDETFKAIAGIREIAKEMGIPMGQLALAWAMARPGITSVLVGTRNISQLQDNVEAASVSVSFETIKRLDDLTEPLLEILGSNPDYYLGGENKRVR